MKTMLFTGFYATLIPMGAAFSIVSVVLVYAIIKYLLLRRFRRPLPINQNLTEEMVDYLELFFICFSAGNMFFEYKIRNTISLWSYICIGVSCASYCVPWKAFSHALFTEAKPNSTEHYDEARLTFYTVPLILFSYDQEYDRANPLTQDEAQKEFEEFVEKKLQNNNDENKAEQVKERLKQNKKPLDKILSRTIIVDP